MNFLSAYVWVLSTAYSHEYGKGRPWGLYTETPQAAAYMGIALGFNGLLPESSGSGTYEHYHSKDRNFKGYKHFHIWFGEILP